MHIVDDKPSLDELSHYGVKGMHWGQRRAANAARAAAPRHESYSKNQQSADRKAFGNKGTDRINESITKGVKIADARNQERKRQQKIKTRLYGGLFVAKVLYSYGPFAMAAGRILLQKGAESYVGKRTQAAGKKAASDLFSDNRGIGSNRIVDLGFDKATGVWG